MILNILLKVILPTLPQRMLRGCHIASLENCLLLIFHLPLASRGRQSFVKFLNDL